MYAYENKENENPFMYKCANIVSKYFGIRFEALFVKTRKREIVQCRQLVYYFTRLTNCFISWDTLAGFFYQDHATAIHGINTVEDLVKTNIEFRKNFNNLYKQLGFDTKRTYPQRNGQFKSKEVDPLEKGIFNFSHFIHDNL